MYRPWRTEPAQQNAPDGGPGRLSISGGSVVIATGQQRNPPESGERAEHHVEARLAVRGPLRDVGSVRVVLRSAVHRAGGVVELAEEIAQRLDQVRRDDAAALQGGVQEVGRVCCGWMGQVRTSFRFEAPGRWLLS